MTDQPPDAARERLLDEIEDFREDTVSADTVLNALDTYAAAVSRARDAAWREAVEAVLGGVGENASERFDYSAHLCMMATGVLPPGKDDPIPTQTHEERLAVWRTFVRTRRVILDALLARMDTATIKQEPTDV